MKNLDFYQMEVINGRQGANSNENLEVGVGIACAAVGVVSLAGSIFTFGASLAFGVAVAGAMCTGATAGFVAIALTEE